MAFLELNHVSKSYPLAGGRTEVLTDINLSIEEGEFVCIVGFSGSGKSTLISLIEGLIEPDSGEILLDGQPIKGPGPDRGIVFQNYSLLPWLNVLGNVSMAVHEAFPTWSKAQCQEQAKKYIEMVNLTPALDKIPDELSGGMKQRVSVARALAMNPKVLLLDEPLSALDALTRGTLQREIEKIWEQDQKTVVMITNDIDEGMLLADRIIPLTIGPGATLGPEFRLDFERPRDKTALNDLPDFKRIRNDLTRHMMELFAEIKERTNVIESQSEAIVLPDIKPVAV